jgi:F420-dependent oxidoreductase-like protein
MIDVSIMVEGQMGVTWSNWKRFAAAVEALGYAGLYRSDHFTDPQPPSSDSLEMVISLTYLADRTERIHFGPCVAPVSFREPVMFVRQAMQIDDLSGGRMVLGLGAGWQEREHHMFGYPLGDVKTRMARFEEGLEVAWRLLRSDGPATFEGQFFQIRDAELLPKPQRPGGPPIMIGGNGPKRTMPLTARFADIWNGVFLTPAQFTERSQSLDALLPQHGRRPEDVRRTVMTGVFFGTNERDLERRIGWRGGLGGRSVAEVIAQMQHEGRVVAGGPEECAAQIRAYADAGAQEIFLQWLDLDDIAGLEEIADLVLPQLT